MYVFLVVTAAVWTQHLGLEYPHLRYEYQKSQNMAMLPSQTVVYRNEKSKQKTQWNAHKHISYKYFSSVSLMAKKLRFRKKARTFAPISR